MSAKFRQFQNNSCAFDVMPNKLTTTSSAPIDDLTVAFCVHFVPNFGPNCFNKMEACFLPPGAK